MLCLVLVLIMAFSFSVNAFGLDKLEIEPGNDYDLNYVALQSAYNYLSMANNTAYCYHKVQVRDGYNGKVTTILQRKNGNTWSEVGSWSETVNRYLETTKEIPISKGYTYRLKTYVNVYNSAGTYVEGTTKFSGEVSY